MSIKYWSAVTKAAVETIDASPLLFPLRPQPPDLAINSGKERVMRVDRGSPRAVIADAANASSFEVISRFWPSNSSVVSEILAASCCALSDALGDGGHVVR